jgi:pyruvate/2-oxoglutarate dehydrogenase complex dihydrolipoamide dehydrogenase (E3) component
VELAQAHRRLGSKVVLVEADHLLGREDREAVAILRERLLGEGIELFENTPVMSVERYGRTGARLHLGGKAEGTIVAGTHLLVATGRRPVTEGLGLEEAGIAHGPDGIAVDARLRTTNRRVHAIGDAVAGPQFTHVASHHAGIVLRSILFRLRVRADRALIPRVTFTNPEIAHIGAREEDARARHREIRVLRSPYSENDRAHTKRDTTGFVKLVTDRRGRILGVSIVGRQAGEMISFWTLAMSRKLRVHDVANLVLPYPTTGEIGKRAAIAYFSPMTRRPLVRRLIRFLRVFG